MSHAGSVFYSILPIKGTPSEVEVMIDLLQNTTVDRFIDANAGALLHDKFFIDEKTKLPKRDGQFGHFAVSTKLCTVFVIERRLSFTKKQNYF